MAPARQYDEDHAASWQTQPPHRGDPETRAADEELLWRLVQAVVEHQVTVPMARVGHLVRRADLQLPKAHA